MSYEIYPDPIGTVVRAKAEATYGADPTIADADTIYAEEVSGNAFVQESIRRNGVAAMRTGFRSAPSKATGTLSLTGEIAHVDLADEDARPSIHPLLMAAAFTVAGTINADYTGPGYTANGGDNDIIVTYSSGGVTQAANGSARVEITQHAQGDATGNLHTFAGFVADFSISYAYGERMMVTFEGMSKPLRPTAVTTPTTDSPYAAETPAMGLGATAMIQRLSDNSVWGGGTAAAPNTAGIGLLSLEINGNNNVQERGGINAAGGVVGFFASATDPHEVTLTLEQTNIADWDWRDLHQDADPVYIRTVVPSASNANLLVEVAFHMMIESIEAGEDNGRRVATISGHTIWPESPGGDGGGLKPASPLAIKYIKRRAA